MSVIVNTHVLFKTSSLFLSLLFFSTVVLVDTAFCDNPINYTVTVLYFLSKCTCICNMTFNPWPFEADSDYEEQVMCNSIVIDFICNCAIITHVEMGITFYLVFSLGL